MVKLNIMTTASNTYADKIYSENPIALWALDEELPESISYSPSITLKSAANSRIYGTRWVHEGEELRAYKYGSVDNLDYGYYMSMPFQRGTLGDTYKTSYASTSDTSSISTLWPSVSSDSVPLVYGSSNVIEVYPTTQPRSSGDAISYVPSLLLPGKGFLNSSSQYADMTLEFWCKFIANDDQTVSKRVVGPVGSEDGVYVSGKSLVLRIGKYLCSAFIGNTNRPILVDVTVSPTSASIMIDGKTAATMSIDISNVNFPGKYINGKESDWLAFYTQTAKSMNLDCVAIYNYCVPEIVAKKRFLYGQAVKTPQSLLAKHGGQSFIVDGAFSNFAKTIKFPQTYDWDLSNSSNLVIQDDKLQLPDYSLPNFHSINNHGIDDPTSWKDNYLSNNRLYFTNSNADIVRQYIEFNQQGKLISKDAGWLIFSFSASSPKSNNAYTEQTLFKLYDKVSQDSLVGIVQLANDESAINFKMYFVKAVGSNYSYSSESTDTDGYISSTLTLSSDLLQVVSTGIDIPYMISQEPESFLSGSPENWVLDIGDSTGQKNFLGELVRVMFVDNSHTNAISQYNHFTDGVYSNGMFQEPGVMQDKMYKYALVFNNIGTYTYPDIAARGFFIHSIPIQMLCKTVDGYRRLDFIQFDDFTTSEDPDYYSYSSPAIKKGVFTRCAVETTATTQMGPYLSEFGQFHKIQEPTLTYDEDGFADQYVTIFTNIVSPGLATETPYLEKIQLSSRISDPSVPIGSKNAVDAYPFGDAVFYTGIQSTPYNYLTGTSGIMLPFSNRVVSGSFDSNWNKGIRIPINKNNSDDFWVQSIQFYYSAPKNAYNSSNEIITDYPLFEIFSQTVYKANENASSVNFGRIRISNEGGILKAYAIQPSGTPSQIDITSLLTITVNGHVISGDVEIEELEWSVIGIEFSSATLNMSGSGSNYGIKILGPGVFDNILFLRIPYANLFERIIQVAWNVSNNGTTKWSNIKSNSATWQDVFLDSAPAESTITAEYLYGLYQGTNRIVIPSISGSPDMTISDESSSVYKNVIWLSQNTKPV